MLQLSLGTPPGGVLFSEFPNFGHLCIGGFGVLSEDQLSICKRAAALECELESAEGKLSGGEPIDINLYARLVRTLGRLFELIGIKRLAKPLDPLSELAAAAAESINKRVPFVTGLELRGSITRRSG